MKITGFPLSIVFLSSSFPFYKRKNEAQRNKEWKQWEEDEKWWNIGKKEWKQWENDEKPRKHIKKMMKHRKKWTQWENDEKRRKSNEKWWKTGNKWKQLENDENAIFFSALLVGDCRCTLRWHMTSENDEKYRVSFIYSFPFIFLSFL